MIKSLAIVGAGIAGIYAALLTKKLSPDTKVTLIEKADHVGGLLSSTSIQGYNFDFGTHVPRLTGHQEIDDILFSNLSTKEWHQFNNINAANCSKDGVLYTQSANPFLVTKQNSNIGTYLHQVISGLDNRQNQYESLEAQLYCVYGQAITEEFFRPCLTKRFGVDLKVLAPNSHKLLGLDRLILGSTKAMRALKKDEQLDEVLAFTNQSEGISPLTNFYPKNNKGVGLWIETLIEQAERLGVDVRTNCELKSVTRQKNGIQSLQFSVGEDLKVDHVCWSLPTFALIRAASLSFKSQYKPTIRQTRLYHYAFTHPFNVESNYINIHDPDFSSFRITLYPNLSNQKTGPYRCTVEVIEEQNASSSPSTAEIKQELIKLDVISNDNHCTFDSQDLVSAGFPVLTQSFFKEIKRQNEFANQQMNNISLIGKASGKSFFIRDVILRVDKEIKALIN